MNAPLKGGQGRSPGDVADAASVVGWILACAIVLAALLSAWGGARTV